MRAFTHWRWRLDEVYVRINDEMLYLSRALQVLPTASTAIQSEGAA